MDRPEDADEKRHWQATDAEPRGERTAGDIDEVPGPEGGQPAATATAERERQAERDREAEREPDRERESERERDEGAGAAAEQQATGNLATPPGAAPQEERDRERETAAPATHGDGRGAPPGQQPAAEVLPASDRPGYRERWDALQAGFIDDPRAAAQQADALIGEVLQRFTERHQALRGRIGESGEGSDTESMRLVLREYRVIFTSLVGE
jgi:hypothetical protein